MIHFGYCLDYRNFATGLSVKDTKIHLDKIRVGIFSQRILKKCICLDNKSVEITSNLKDSSKEFNNFFYDLPRCGTRKLSEAYKNKIKELLLYWWNIGLYPKDREDYLDIPTKDIPTKDILKIINSII